ncbi:hypothetical protein ABT120_38565 [Nonomuraea angiospora]|uniref:hypothetical protein n=1 Tax=Nonomuraea angiospora TaxID=46172 RepID=UPI00331F49D8
MGDGILIRATVFVAFTVVWLATGGSATLLWPAIIAVAVGLALHAWIRRRTRKENRGAPL